LAYNFFIQNQLDINILHKACDYNFDEINESETRIPFRTFLNSLRIIKQNININDSFPVELSKNIKLTDLGEFGFILLSAPTLEEGLNFIVENFKCITQTIEFELLEKNKDLLYLNIKCQHHYKELTSEFLEYLYINVKLYLSSFCNSPIPINKIRIKNNQRKSDNISITISKRKLSRPSPMAQPIFFFSNKDKLSMYMKNINHCEDHILLLQDLIRASFHRGIKPTLSDISDQLGTTTKTIYRNLKSNNTNFQYQLDKITCELIKEEIQNGLELKEIAYALGFKSTEGLNYVFKKLNHVSINQYKNTLYNSKN